MAYKIKKKKSYFIQEPYGLPRELQEKDKFFKVSEEQQHKGEIINASIQTRVWINEAKGSKDKKYKIVYSKLEKKYPKLTDYEINGLIFRYL